MKNLIAGTIFWIIILGILFFMAVVAEILSKVITIDMIVGCIYTMFFAGIIFVLRNS